MLSRAVNTVVVGCRAHRVLNRPILARLLSTCGEDVTLSQPQIVEAAQRLHEARMSGQLIDISDDPAWIPRSVGDMYAVQDALIGLPGNEGRLVGWKVGATNKATQERLGLSSPFAGPIFDYDVVKMEVSCPSSQCQPHVEFTRVGCNCVQLFAMCVSLVIQPIESEVFDAHTPNPELPSSVGPVHTIDTTTGMVRGVESEFGIVLGQTMQPFDDSPFTAADVRAHGRLVVMAPQESGS